MRPLLLAFIALLVSLVSCTVTPSPPPTDTRAAALYAFTFHADESFTLTERLDIVLAATDWSLWSKGKVSIDVRWDEGSPRIFRMSEADPEVLKHDAKKGANLYGWALTDIYLVPERVPSERFRGVTAHEMGHAVGLKWPGCYTGDCFHVSSPGSLMSARYEDETKWTDADLALCRASRLCD